MRKRLRCPPPTLHSVATHRGGGTRTGVERQCQGRRRCPHFGGAGCPGGGGERVGGLGEQVEGTERSRTRGVATLVGGAGRVREAGGGDG